MTNKRWLSCGTAVSAAAGLGYATWQRSRSALRARHDVPAEHSCQLLERAAPLLRLPASSDRAPQVLPDGSGLRSPSTGRVYTYGPGDGRGILDLLPAEPGQTFTQKALDTPLTVWFYDRFRETITGALNSPDFASEVAHIQQDLQAGPGDTILDLACGQGNFTVEWAKRVGPAGLVIGLDIALAMLERAAYHINRWGLDNVLLIRGDAHHLPLAVGVLRKIARVSALGAVLTASTFAEGIDDRRAPIKRWLKRRFDLHFVPLADLGDQLGALGYGSYDWLLPGSGWFGYTASRKTV
jgi:hypothetical protein